MLPGSGMQAGFAALESVMRRVIRPRDRKTSDG